MIRALYLKRPDGKYAFAAAFAIDENRYDGDVADTFAEELRQEGEDVLIVRNCSLNKLKKIFRP